MPQRRPRRGPAAHFAVRDPAVAAALAARVVYHHVAEPVSLALNEWRRTLHLPTSLIYSSSGGTAGLALSAPNSDRGNTSGLIAPQPASNPWILATASWTAATKVETGLVFQRMWLPQRITATVFQQHKENSELSDLRVLSSDSPDAKDQLAALERTIERIPWHPRSSIVRRALAARAGLVGSVREVKRQELRAAVYLVLAERGRPQFHRFGRRWLAGADGRPTAAIPEQMDETLYWRWFCDEVRKAAEASLLGERYVPHSSDEAARRERSGGGPQARDVNRHQIAFGSRELDGVADPAPDPLEQVLAEERRQEARERWRAALSAASPRQQELLKVIAMLDLTDGNEASSLAAAARRLGMAPSTARVQWKRLMGRLRKLYLSAP